MSLMTIQVSINKRNSIKPLSKVICTGIHRLSMNRCTMMRLTGHAKQHDSNQRVSGIPGAVHSTQTERRN